MAKTHLISEKEKFQIGNDTIWNFNNIDSDVM